ncbi:MAG: hypothetical protein HKN47_18310, partial [Pirellulaceae bacterium]|nr:hypothetical protein [Pirellulaceae bacterium]
SGGVNRTISIGPPGQPMVLLDGRAFGHEINGQMVRQSGESNQGVLLWIDAVP